MGEDNDLTKEEDSEKDVNGNPLIIYADLYNPDATNASVIPTQTNEEEPQQVNVSAVVEDYETGIDTTQPVMVEVEGVGEIPAEVTPTDEEGISQIQTTFESPPQEGTYQVTLVVPQDKAGNGTNEKKNLGTLKVKPKPKDQPTNPDESRDHFGSTLAGVAPPRFGAPRVAVLRSGYAVEMRDLLASFGEAADFISPEEFSPTAAAKYRVIIVPSAGLARVENIPNLRKKFSAYVSAGGTLLVMAQPMDTCYKFLPDKVESIGYYQDKACYTATAGIRKYTPALAGQSDTTVDGTADGVLTSWPEGTEIWLYRLKNNFPALLMYRHGNGRVIVSNYYSDYARGHAQLHRDERALLRDLLSWARDFAEIPEIRPGGKITLNVPVVYAPEAGREAPAAKGFCGAEISAAVTENRVKMNW